MTHRLGYFYAIAAYSCWGFFPIYWKLIKHVPPLEILCHRVVWAFLFYCSILIYKKRKFTLFWPENRTHLVRLSIGSLFLMANWFVYIYAVNNNRILESSLGYFINPILNILVGVFILGEVLNLSQKLATGLAVVGVMIISVSQGEIPWLALFLAGSFSLYGLTKKVVTVPALESNQYESMILLPLTIALLLFLEPLSGSAPFQWGDSFYPTLMLLVGGGIVTGLPLIFFTEAAQRLPFYMMGFFQFLSPSFQFLSGAVIFGEPLSRTKLFGFMFIWAAGGLVMMNQWFIVRRFRRDSKASVISTDSKTT
ncbi:MAG: EamA family transporter RarD [Bdellovibrionales bacterium]|nr:EamA family transporter RarD [Bdellovibrionales bacterium]